MMPMQLQQMHMQQVPNQSQQPPQAQQQPPSQTQQNAQTPHLQQNQHFLSAHSQADQNQRNGMKQREQALFNSYVYDFLKRSGASETARTYLREGGENIKLKNDGTNSINGANSSSDSDVNAPLPEADVPVQAPEGFLYEWWSVFWDIYSAKLNRPGTVEAQRYVAELRRGSNRMHISQIPTMNNYQQHPQAQAAAQHQQQQQQIQRLQQMQQLPQHPQQQAQQASQQAVQQQQQQQQAPPQQSQPPQPPQQTPQPQPQPSPANHQQVTHQQPQPFNNRQPMPNGVIDANNTNGDMLATSPRATMKITQGQAIRRSNIPLQQMQMPNRAALMAMQQHALQNTAAAHQAQIQAQVQAQVQQQAQQAQQVQAQVQSQAAAQVQNSQQIQSQGQQGQQQQNSGVNQGQVQQQATPQHMTPNQVPAQLNPGTKRGVEGQAINQNMSQQATSPNKRQRIMDPYGVAGQRQQQPQNHQQGQMAMNQMMLTTPISNDIASSPDIKNRQAHLTNGKKANPQLQQQLNRAQQQQQQQQQQMTPINKSHVNQQINSMVPMNEPELMNQINNMKAASNQTLSSISSFPIGMMNRLPPNYGMVFPINNINNQRVRTVPDGHKIHPNMLIAEKSSLENFSKRNIELTMRPNNIPQQLLYFQQQQQVVPHHTSITADVGPNNSPSHLRKNDAKGVKNAAKTTTTPSQPQPLSGNASNVAISQQSIIGANGVQTQSQPPNQATSTTSVMNKLPDGSLNMNLDEVKNYYSFDQLDMDGTEFDMNGGSVTDFDINDFVTFDNLADELGSNNNGGPSTSTTNGN